MIDYRQVSMDRVSEALAKVQDERNLSTYAMSRLLGVNHTTYRSWLKKTADMRVSNAIVVCKKLGITPNELIGGAK